MSRYSVGTKLYLGVLSIFLLFAVGFILFQKEREKQFKIDTLTIRLQCYNNQMYETLHAVSADSGRFVPGRFPEEMLAGYVAQHRWNGLRVTVIRPDGTVVFDNQLKDYARFANHANRTEIAQALKQGYGSTIERKSMTLKHDYFYSATYFPKDSIIIRSALPYNDDLSKSLQADQHYIWFALLAILLLTLVLYRFVNRLGQHITKLRLFASRADHNESLETEELAAFPDDELGEIAERIIKIYKRLQTTRQEQDMLKRQLTQNIAHELKTPVASIQGYLETVIANPQIGEEKRAQFLQRCHVQCERLASLLRDISTLNRMDDAPGLTDFEPVDISGLVAEIQEETALQMQERGMAFVNHLPAGITAVGNRSLLYSIFRNLMDNAVAYSGGGTTVTLEGMEQGDKWHFTFSDNGVGIAAQHLPRIFERFYRADKGRSRKLGGTGLGLAIVKNAVLLHGGTIQAINNPDGNGLKFTFTIRK